MKLPEFDVVQIYKKWYVLLIAAFIITTISYLIGTTGFFKEVELKFTDYRFRLDPVPAKADSNIVIVAIDDGSIDFFAKNGIPWPWPRSYYGYIIDYFTRSNAKAVFFDVIFDSADTEREETSSEQTDGDFANAMKNNRNVFLATKLTEDSTKVSPVLNNFSLNIYGEKYPFENIYLGLREPIDVLLNATKSVGVINVIPDRDGVIRKVPILQKVKNNILPQLAFSVFLNQRTDSLFIQKKHLVLDTLSIPIDKNGQYLVNWYAENAFKYYPFQAVIQSASAVYSGNTPLIPPDVFKDKYIIIGATASGLNDLRATPISSFLPGMEIWTTILSNFIHQDFVKVVPIWFTLMFTLIICFLANFTITHFPMKQSNFLLFLLLAFITLLNYFLWKNNRILLNFIIPIMGFVLSYGFYVTISYLVEGKAKAEIKKIFTRYLSPDVIDELEKHPHNVELGGKEIEATVMFSDIYDFTTYSEGKTPTEVVKNLNEYFDKLTNFVLDNDGLLDKYTGDGIMALFGVPIFRKDNALIACKAAIAHKKYCQEISKKKNLTVSEQLHLGTRLGINTGSIIAGNIGSIRRMDYTAIGDAANAASRLEGVNKFYKTDIIISESTYELVKNDVICRDLDIVRVKGKTLPTKIYQLIDEKNGNSKPEWIVQYEQALEMYRNAKWKEAIKIFEKLANAPLEDKPSKVMLDRCMKLRKTNPKNWDGVLTLETK